MRSNQPKASFITIARVRRHCNHQGKRLSPDFIVLLDNHVRAKLNSACAVHNGGRRTLDASVAGFVGLTSSSTHSNN